MQCTPKTFESSDGYNGKTILSTALAQCECIGHKVEGVDISVLPGEDEGLGESILKSCGSGSGVTTKGPIPIDEDNDSGKGSSGNSASSAQDDNKGAVQSGSSGAGTLASKPAGTGTPAAATGGIGANPKSPTSSSTPSPAEAQSTTGAASIIQVQHILALLMAGMISSILL